MLWYTAFINILIPPVFVRQNLTYVFIRQILAYEDDPRAEGVKPSRLSEHKTFVYNLYNVRRWADVVQMLYKCFVFTGDASKHDFASLKNDLISDNFHGTDTT